MRRFALFLAGVTFMGLVSVYEEVEAVKIGYKIQKQEEWKVQALDRARALKYNRARLEAPNNLERKLIAQRIQLESPKEWQTLVLPGAGAAGSKNPMLAPADRQLFFMKLFVGTAQAEAKESSAR